MPKKKKSKQAPKSPSPGPKPEWDDESDDEPKQRVQKKPKKNKNNIESPSPMEPPKQNKKKKKKKGKGAPISDEESETITTKFNDDSEDEHSTKQPKKKQKQKKKTGGAPISDHESEEEKPVKKQGKKKKKKKGKCAPVSDNESQDDKPIKQKKQKKPKKGKKKEVEKSREEILEEIKIKKQEELLNYGNSKMENLHSKYGDYFNDERKELWEESLTEKIGSFGDHLSDVEKEECYNELLDELNEVWDMILNDMDDEMNEDLNKKKEEEEILKRQAKIEEFKKMGLNVGPKGVTQNNAKKKKTGVNMKKKLALMRKKLAEQDKLEKEKEDLEEKKKVEIKPKKKEPQKVKQKKVGNWEDVSDNEEKIKKKGKIDKFEDDSSDENSNEKKKKKRRKKKKERNEREDIESNNKNSGKIGERMEVEEEEKEVTNEFDKFDDMTKEELRKELQKLKLSGGGKKEELLERLKKHVKITEYQENSRKEGHINNKISKPKKKKLRSPICVVMGHVDTGKTKILDYIRKSRVQDKEVGGITQQIGATFLSKDYIKSCTSRLKEQFTKIKFKVPGLLFIDTPGHEAFANLRARGSSMCDIAIVVVDIMHYLENQTIESIKLLKKRGAPFIVALNKIDRCYEWKPDNDAPFEVTYKKQSQHTKKDFEKRLEQTKLEFSSKLGINSEVYYQNKNQKSDVSLVPTSAHTGEGIPDLLYLLCQLTEKYMKKNLGFEADNFKASVLEVKQVEGYGSTIDVILSNGTLHPDDTIIVSGMNGPICSKIRAILLPGEAQEMRVKGQQKVITEPVHASIGVRIACQDSLEFALAGSELFVVPRHLKGQKRYDVIEGLKDDVQGNYAKILEKVDKSNSGVYVQASTLGSLEALITFLTSIKPPIPISGIGIGNIHKQDIMKASVNLEKNPELAVILAFNVKMDNDARQIAIKNKVKVFEAEIIYHLQEMFEEYIKKLRENAKELAKDIAVFPCEFQIISIEHIFHNKNPFVLGVEIKRGTLRLNTPIVVKKVNKAGTPIPLYLGKVTNIKLDDKDVKTAKLGQKVSIKIEGDDTTKNIQAGRNFEHHEVLVSRISKDSIAALKQFFADEVEKDKEMIQHLFQLKNYFGII